MRVQLLQRCRQAGVSSGAGDGERQAAQRVGDPQSPAVPAVEELRRPLVPQRTRPHLQPQSVRGAVTTATAAPRAVPTRGVQEKWSTFRASTSCSRSRLSPFTLLQTRKERQQRGRGFSL